MCKSRVPPVSSNAPKPLSPAVLATSAKLGLSSPSTSLMLIDPVAVTGASPTSPSVTATRDRAGYHRRVNRYP